MKTPRKRLIASRSLVILFASISGIKAQVPTPTNSAPLIVCVTNAPVIRVQPQDQYAQDGMETVTFVVAAEGTPPDLGSDFKYQWQKNTLPGLSNYVDILATNNPSATSNVFTISDARTNDVAYYRVVVSGNGTTISEPAMLLVWTTNSPLTVFGTPYYGNGSSDTCPGCYIGYVSYPKPPYTNWGFKPLTNCTPRYVKDVQTSQDNRIFYVGSSGDTGCAKVQVTVPNLVGSTMPISAQYRFTLYFQCGGTVGSNPYPLLLNCFQ